MHLAYYIRGKKREKNRGEKEGKERKARKNI